MYYNASKRQVTSLACLFSSHRRICFLETVAGVPGMVAAMTRHLHSLRRLKRDHGWIHTLLGTDHAIGYINVIYAGRIVWIHAI